MFAMNSISVIAGIAKRFMARILVQGKGDKGWQDKGAKWVRIGGEDRFGRNFTQIIIKSNGR